MSSRALAVRLSRSLLTCAVLASAAHLTVPPRAAHADQSVAQTPPPPQERPRLLVLIVVDQFRADYVEWYGDRWTAGLHRLFTEGAYFARARYPYASTRTCAGHASISTGALPAAHGMVDNDWWDASRRVFTTCTDDPSVTPVGFGGRSTSERHSARLLRVPTLADELLRQQPGARVVSVALKPRTAITLGGHGGAGSLVVWTDGAGTWSSSSAYGSAGAADVDRFARTRPMDAARGQIWQRLLPADAYRFGDLAAGEVTPATFPHPLTASTDSAFVGVWEASPWSDAAVATLAGDLIRHLDLGRRERGTDLLTLGFAALDYVGHNYGPRSHEVQDVLIRLDRLLGTLLSTLDAEVGRDRYTVALSSDHGVALLPEQAAPLTGTAGGRVDAAVIARTIATALLPQFGRQAVVDAVSGNSIYFRPGILERLRAEPAAVSAVEAAARTVPGVEAVYWAPDLLSQEPTTDALLTGLRKSYVGGRSGDLLVVTRPHWILSANATSHGSMQTYDTDVPLVFFGHGIKTGRLSTPRTPLDLAPTLAALAGVTMSAASGSVARDALLP